MSHAVRRDATDVGAPPELGRMLKRWSVDYRVNVENELRKRRHAVAPGERRRLKRHLALKRLRKQQRAA